MRDESQTRHEVPAGELLRTALASFDDLFFVFGEDGAFRYWNPAVVEATGYDDAQLASMTPADFFEGEDAQRVRAAVAEVFDTGSTQVEATLVTADGDRIPYEFHASRLTDASGDVQGFAGIGRDVTERREAQRQRRALLDRMTDAFFAVDEGWHLTYVNERARTILSAAMGLDGDGAGGPDADIEGRHLWEAIPEAVDTPFYETYHEAMETQEPSTLTEYYEPLDTWFEVRAYPSETGLSVYFRDVTERQRREAALEERERVLREVYEVISDTDRSFDEQVGALLDIGRDVVGTAYGALSHVSGDDYEFEVVRAPPDGPVAGETAPLEATNCERAVATEQTLVLADVASDAPELTDRAGYREWGIACYLGAPVVVEDEVYGTFCFYDKQPREEPFSDWAVTLVDLLSQWVGYELTHRRVRERLERQNEQLDEFASIVSHDLRNPLNVLQGSLNMLGESGTGSGPDEHIERCRRATRRMTDLVEDLLTLARAGEWSIEPEPVVLTTAVEESWAAVATDDATLVVETDRTVLADPDRLRQVLENLLRNAVEHGSTSPGSQARQDAAEHGSTGSRPGADDAVEHGSTDDPSNTDRAGVTVTVGDADEGFFVADDGPGIPADERDRVFESGYSTAEDGTGFGLNIVRRVAQAHGWTVTVGESESGGARFEFVGVESA